MTDIHLMLYRLAELMLENEQYMLPVDMLFDDTQIGDFAKSIQIDSPYQQMLLEGVLTESVRDEKLYVSFTVEGYLHFVLGEVLEINYYENGKLGLNYILGLIEQSTFSHIEKAASQFFVNQINQGEFTIIQSLIESDFNRKTVLTPAIIQSLLLNLEDNYIFRIDDIKLWDEILQKLIQISKYDLISKCIAKLKIKISKNLLSPYVIQHLNNELLHAIQKESSQGDLNFALEFYSGRYDNLIIKYRNRKKDLPITEIDLSFVASACIDTGEFETALLVLNELTISDNNFIELHRLKSIAFNGLSQNQEAVESISIALKKSYELNGQYHFRTAELINLKGMYFIVESAFEEAIICFEICARIYTNLKGDSNFEYATVVNNIGLVLFHKNDIQGAIEKWREAISVLSLLGMKFHPETANIYKSLACCYEKLGHSENALLCVKKSLNILNEYNLQDSKAALECKQIINRLSRNDL